MLRRVSAVSAPLLLAACAHAAPPPPAPVQAEVSAKVAPPPARPTVFSSRLGDEFHLGTASLPLSDEPPDSPSTVVALPDEGLLIVTAALRWTLHGRAVATAPAAPERLDGALPIPKRLGGGYLFFGERWLWRADSPLGALRPFVYHAGDSAGPVFADAHLLLRSTAGDRVHAFRMTDGVEERSPVVSAGQVFRVGDAIFSSNMTSGAQIWRGGVAKALVAPNGARLLQLVPTPTGATGFTRSGEFAIDLQGNVTARAPGSRPDLPPMLAMPTTALAAQGATHRFPDGTIAGASSEAGDEFESDEGPLSDTLRLFPHGASDSTATVTLPKGASCRLYDGEGSVAAVLCNTDGGPTSVYPLRSDGTLGAPTLTATTDDLEPSAGYGHPLYFSSPCAGGRNRGRWCIPQGDRWVEIPEPADVPPDFGALGRGGRTVQGAHRFYGIDIAYPTGDGGLVTLRRGEKVLRVERVDGAGTKLLFERPMKELGRNTEVLYGTAAGAFYLLDTVYEDEVAARARPRGKVGTRVLRLDAQGLHEIAHFKVAAAFGKRLLATTDEGAPVESDDGGLHVRPTAGPPGGFPSIERCTAAGCYVGPLFRTWDGPSAGFAFPSSVPEGGTPPPPAAATARTLTCVRGKAPSVSTTYGPSADEAPATLVNVFGSFRGGNIPTDSGSELRVLLPFEVAPTLRTYAEPTLGPHPFGRPMVPALGAPGVSAALILTRPSTSQKGPTDAGLYVGPKATTVVGNVDATTGHLLAAGRALASDYTGDGRWSIVPAGSPPTGKGDRFDDPLLALRGATAVVIEGHRSHLPPTAASPFFVGKEALPPWSSLAPVGAPGCTGDGLRFLTPIPPTWLDVRWPDGGHGTLSDGFAILRVGKGHLCLEAYDGVLSVTAADRVVASADVAPTRSLIVRYGAGAGGQVATFHGGTFKSEPVVCTLP